MNRAEKPLLNNPVRRLLQRTLEAQALERHGGRVLEVGCGTRLLLERFQAGQVDAIDLDPAQVRLAWRRVHHRDGVHHVPNWPYGVAAARVRRTGGVCSFEEISRRALACWTYTFFEHQTEDWFDPQQLTAELSRHGLRPLQPVSVWWFGDYVLGAAVRDG